MRPLRLPPNQPLHFYQGGQRIARFRGGDQPLDNRPEDWLGSTTTRFGSATLGLSTLPDGHLLRDEVAADPEAWLGPEHAAKLGADTYLLVKLLDPAQRLPVHAHPDRTFARQHLGLRHGKTEAWIVLGTTGSEASVYLGFVTDIESADLQRWVDEQNTEALLGSLHRLDVAPGDSVLVPAGTPHAIGAGMFCIELQEPTDLSIMLETEGFDQATGEGDLGLGYDAALECVRRSAVPAAELDRLRRTATDRADADPVQAVFSEQAAPFFRAERIRPSQPVTVPASFAVVVTVAGEGTLVTEQGGELATRRGDTILVPHSAGALTVSGPVDVVRCLPPRPDDVVLEPAP